MADNIELDAGTGGATVAADDVGGVHYQVVKLDVGADGVAAPVSNSNPVPVSDAGSSLTVDNAGLTELAAAINASSQMDVNIAASNATVTVANAGLTELAAAINSNQVDVNIAASAATLTVASHAVTNAGTFVVQENGAALTALQLLDNSVYVDDADWTDNTSSHLLVGGVYQSTQHTVTDGDVSPLAVDANGNLRVNIVAGAAAGGTSVADDADFTDGTTALTPVGGVYESTPSSVTDGDIGMVGITETRALRVHVSSGGVSGIVDDAAFTAGSSEGVLMMGVASADTVDANDAGAIAMTTARAMHVAVQNTVTVGSHAVTNAGTFAVQVDGSALTALQLIDNANVADDAAFTAGSTGVVMGGFFADETATDSVDEGDGGAARMTLDRKQIVTPYAHATAGGHTPYKNLDCDESEDEIKGSAGKLFWIHVINLANAKRYLKLYNDTAANVAVGTTVPVLTFPIPTMADTNGAGFTIHFGDAGCAFSTAICVAATTGFADNDTGAPGANEVIFNAGYL